jgi:hypothetical protein
MDLIRIAKRIAHIQPPVGTVVDPESDKELFAILKKFEERERKYGRDPGVMRIEERPFNLKNYPKKIRELDIFKSDSTIELIALSEEGSQMFSGSGKTWEEASDDLKKSLKKGLWR